MILLAGCSSQKQVTRQESSQTEITTRTSTDPAWEPLLPRPALEEIAPVPEVNLADRDPLLDRARLHLLLASKALQAKDTAGALDQCELGGLRLAQVAELPNRDETDAFRDLVGQLFRLINLSGKSNGWLLPESLAGIEFEPGAELQSPVPAKLLAFKEPPTTTIPLPLNEDVERNIVYFSTKMRNHFEKWLERSTRYFPVMRPILKEEGMPDEIIYLTMIESGVNPLARSWAKCIGLWQFLKSTGELYGLRGDWYFDDRRNPEKATRAAARHLRDLYNRYNDWHLALAAYNAGAGRIDRAIARSGKERPSYWDIRHYLPSETQEYVPRFVATAIIALNQEAYDFVELKHQKPLEYDFVSVDNTYRVEDLAECVGIPSDEFVLLNPHLLQGVTPPGVKGFEIRVPKGRRDTFVSNLSTVSPARTVEMLAHKVRRGETLQRLAKSYGVAKDDIMRANEMSRDRKLVSGEVLKIPRMSAVSQVSLATAMDNLSNPTSQEDEVDTMKNTKGRERSVLTVEEGMTLGGIAARYSVTVHNIMTWNSLKANDTLLPGAELVIWRKPDDPVSTSEVLAQARQTSNEAQPPALVKARASSPEVTRLERYRVQKGETLASIASAFKVSLQNLMKWNDLKTQTVRSGKVLKIHVPVSHIAGKPVFAQQEQPKRETEPSTRTDSTPIDVHEVQQGETLWGIARQHGISNDDLMKWNGLKSEVITVGSKLRLKPVAQSSHAPADGLIEHRTRVASPSPEKKTPQVAEAPATHVVEKGETVWSISKKYGIAVDDLSRWNGLKDGQVRVGQSLMLAGKANEANATVESAPSAGTNHIVRRGESLISLARQYAVTVDELRTWNSLTNDVLRIGQELIVQKPQADSNASKSKEYTVQRGDSLYGISRRLGVKMEDLSRWNDRTETLQPGQILTYFETE